MKQTMEYKGFLGSIEISVEDNCLHGQLLFIRDLVTYEANSPAELEKEFHAAVDDYLETCAAIGVEPKKPCSGTFNVRIGPEQHLAAAEAATLEGINLNEFVKQAIKEKIDRAKRTERTEVHIHQHNYSPNTTFKTTLPLQPQGVTFNEKYITLAMHTTDQEKTSRH